MAQETEIEFKNLLTQEEYQQLLNTFNLTHKDIKEQTNHYFDTPNGLLKQKKRGLRIRVLSSKIEFTLKTPGKDDYTYLEITDYLETYNKNLSLTEQSFHPTSDVLTFLEKENFPINELNQIGSLTTYRSEIKLNPDATVQSATLVKTDLSMNNPNHHAIVDSALRAVRNPKCSPLKLPLDRYDQWKSISIRFDLQPIL